MLQAANTRVALVLMHYIGIGIGAKSATIPIYAAECAPANVRGALVMMWQMFTVCFSKNFISVDEE